MADAPGQDQGGDTAQREAAQQDTANKPEDSQAALARAWRDAEHILPLVRICSRISGCALGSAPGSSFGR
eukprot:1543271-Rhodomonas_salina.2